MDLRVAAPASVAVAARRGVLGGGGASFRALGGRRGSLSVRVSVATTESAATANVGAVSNTCSAPFSHCTYFCASLALVLTVCVAVWVGFLQSEDEDREARNPKTVVAVVLGGGAGTRLFPLTKRRAKPAVSTSTA